MKQAYNLISKDNVIHSLNLWHLIWEVQVPVKIANFVWRLCHDSLPTFLTLKNRDVRVDSSCPLCAEDEESSSHLLLFYTFAREVWHGTPLVVHTSDLRNVSVQQWLGQILLRHKNLDQDNMKYLQGIFTTLWSIWTHRNLVVHERKLPNPLEVILTIQSLVYRYAEAFDCCSSSIHRSGIQSKLVQIPCGPWQFIVKVAGARLKRMNRVGYAFEAKTTHANSILQGVYSCTNQPIPVIIQGAMLEAALKARELGFKHILFLSDCRRVV